MFIKEAQYAKAERRLHESLSVAGSLAFALAHAVILGTESTPKLTGMIKAVGEALTVTITRRKKSVYMLRTHSHTAVICDDNKTNMTHSKLTYQIMTMVTERVHSLDDNNIVTPE